MASSRVIAIRSGICGCFRFSKELKKRKIDPADFTPLGDQGLRVYELAEGRGDAVEAGARVVVHFDVTFRGITVVSSRQARTLGGNRTVAEPFEFVVGESVSGRKVRGGGGATRRLCLTPA